MDGTYVAKLVRDEIASLGAQAGAEGAQRPGLATVLIGDDPGSEADVRNKRLACIAVGMLPLHRHLPAGSTQDAVADVIAELAADPAVSGIVLQLPAPAHVDAEALAVLIPPDKDVDGLATLNAGRLTQGFPGLRPCTPSGVIRLLDAYDVPIEGAHAVVVGRSALAGRPMTQLLHERNASVTTCHSRTRDLARVCRQADILVVAAGAPGIVGPDAVRPGATVVDIGIHRDENGVHGDVDYDAVAEVAGLITRVPGGVGPVTIAMLLANTLQAALMHAGPAGRAPALAPGAGGARGVAAPPVPGEGLFRS